ncbi:MAG: MinD/ParA family protein [Methanobacteriota archaeon]
MSPGTVMTLHSYKGGTGKTFISTNLAATLSKEGKNVCLIDFDLRAPSLDKVFGTKGRKFWINDFLDGRCDAGDILFDFSKSVKNKGSLFVALANPSMGFIREAVTREKKWEMKALRRLIMMNKYLTDKMAIDYIILDTNPGLSYSSINAVAAADFVLVVSTWDASDLSGAQGMVKELYGMLEKRAMVIMNKIPSSLLTDKAMRKKMTRKLEDSFRLPVIDLLPCDCEIIREERSSIIVLEKPNHPLSRSLVDIAHRIGQK